jgi:mRNA interferase RelE/StbE
MIYKFVFTKSAEKDLDKMPQSSRKRILSFLEKSSKENPFLKAKKLKSLDYAAFRLRVGDYRVVFRVDPESQVVVVLIVLRIAMRKEIY